VAITGAPVASWTPLRNTGQWVMGTALGLYFTPLVVGLIAGLQWAIALNMSGRSGWSWAAVTGFTGCTARSLQRSQTRVRAGAHDLAWQG